MVMVDSVLVHYMKICTNKAVFECHLSLPCIEIDTEVMIKIIVKYPWSCNFSQ